MPGLFNRRNVWLRTRLRLILIYGEDGSQTTVYILGLPGESASQQNMIWIGLVSAFLVLQPAKAIVDCGVSGVYRRM